MADTKFQIKRTSVSGRLPNTTNSSNTSYIDAGELAINLTDEKVYSSNGTTAFEVGANLTSLKVSSIVANGTTGTANQVLTSNGTTVYWDTVTGGGGGGGTLTFSNTAPGSPSVGDVWVESEAGIKYTYVDDGDTSQWVELEPRFVITTLTANLASVNTNIVPAANITYDLGTSTMRWRDLYLSGSTIDLGGAKIQTDANSGSIALIPTPTEENPHPKAAVITPGGGVVSLQSNGGVITSGDIDSVASSEGIGMTTGKAIAMAIVFGG